MAKVILRPIGTPLDEALGAAEQARNRARMAELERVLRERRDEVAAGWGPGRAERVHAKGRWTARERVEALRDPGTPLLPLGTFANWGFVFGEERRTSPAAGVLTCLARVRERWAVVVANDNTVAAGAWWPRTPEKIQRAQEIARRLRLPVVYLVDSSGLYLPEQAATFAGRTGAGGIFAASARLSDAQVPQIAGVLGDSIAGGGYLPIISDRVFMTEQAYLVVGGAALVRGARGQEVAARDIGGPDVHVHASAIADERFPDDATLILRIREEVGRLPSSAADWYRFGAEAAEPRFSPAELGALFPGDHRVPYDMRQVLARLVDGSLFGEALAHTGPEVLTGVARLGGLHVGVVANSLALAPHPRVPGRLRPGGILYREGIAKIAQFARACEDDGLPLVWLQDVSGFDIGAEAEREGLLGYGSSLIYGNATHAAPMFTVLLRRASGAGYYAMAGMPYGPVVQLSTPLARLGVMEGRTLAAAADAPERAAAEQRVEADMDPWRSAARLDTDEIVSLPELRTYLVALAEASYQAIGYRRVKNPRIWALHDLGVLVEERDAPGRPELVARVEESGDERLVRAPAVGVVEGLPAPGEPAGGGCAVGVLTRAGLRHVLRLPAGVQGVVREALVGPGPAAVEHGQPLLRLGAEARAPAEAPQAPAPAQGAAGLPVRAPCAGVFYRRPAPDRPPYVVPGDEVRAGALLGLVEVMKTFHPVVYGGPGLPERAVVVRADVGDAAEVSFGQELFAVRPA